MIRMALTPTIFRESKYSRTVSDPDVMSSKLCSPQNPVYQCFFVVVANCFSCLLEFLFLFQTMGGACLRGHLHYPLQNGRIRFGHGLAESHNGKNCEGDGTRQL